MLFVTFSMQLKKSITVARYALLSICCSMTLITIDVQLLLFQFTGCFYIRTLVSHFHHLFHLFGREPLGLVELGFYRTDGFPTTSVKALKRIQSNNSNQCRSSIFFFIHNRTSGSRALLSLRQMSNASTGLIGQF